MAGQLTKPKDQPTPYLSSNQQDLLLAALNSQAGSNQQNSRSSVGDALLRRSGSDPAAQSGTMSGANGTLFMSPQDAALDNFDINYTPDVDYLDGDSFDFENADLGGEMIGALPGSGSGDDSPTTNGDGHEKRKSPDEDAEAPEGDAKRQETEDGEKGAKKPGRKPLTTEPTTKRKAQNRAAQRAFRERKEKHLKDLETKVTELSKAQEADKHENGLLKAQVERLQIELREYRKRLSLNSGAVRGSSPLNAVGNQHRSNSGSYSGGFQFDFPKFGGLPGSQLFGNQNISNGNSPINKASGNTPPVMTQSPTSLNGHQNSMSQSQASRQNSMGRSMSPQSIQENGSNVTSPTQMTSFDTTFAPYSTNNNMHGFASTLPQMGNDGFGDLFSPSILKGANAEEYFGGDSKSNVNKTTSGFNMDNGGDSTAGLNRVFQFNSGSISDSTSPSASSSSQWNANGNSSCGTSPEPSHDSPALKDNKEKPADTFCDRINPNKPQTQNSQSTSTDYNSQAGMNSMFGFANNDFNVPSLNSFDPVLFGDYRDSNDAVIGGGDFTGGFFDDALNPAPFDMGSPSNLFGILQSPQQTHTSLNVSKAPASASTPSRNLMAEIEKTRDGDNDEHLVSAQPRKKDSNGKYVSCNSIWNQLQSNPDFQEGKFDLDGLCSELRVKAKCSESGVMVDQDHVDAALKKLGQKDEHGKPFEVPPLMFEQDSWDNVMRKLRNNGAQA